MDSLFCQHIFEKQRRTEAVPPNEVISSWAVNLIRLLYPEQAKKNFETPADLGRAFADSQQTLLMLMRATKACETCDNEKVTSEFFDVIPYIYEMLNKDAEAIFEGDPAAKSKFEVIRTYPGFFAISLYRLAHELLRLEVPLLPRILTEHAHSKTGIDIHPAAEIGEYFFIDHGTGIVIGETSQIGDRVKLYQGVNLGALSVEKDMQYIKRHPTVENNVVIYSGATILGGDTVIGHDSIIGGNVWLIKSVPPHSKVFHKPAIDVVSPTV